MQLHLPTSDWIGIAHLRPGFELRPQFHGSTCIPKSLLEMSARRLSQLVENLSFIIVREIASRNYIGHGRRQFARVTELRSTLYFQLFAPLDEVYLTL